jgi:hypothetical protein
LVDDRITATERQTGQKQYASPSSIFDVGSIIGAFRDFTLMGKEQF